LIRARVKDCVNTTYCCRDDDDDYKVTPLISFSFVVANIDTCIVPTSIDRFDPKSPAVEWLAPVGGWYSTVVYIRRWATDTLWGIIHLPRHWLNCAGEGRQLPALDLDEYDGRRTTDDGVRPHPLWNESTLLIAGEDDFASSTTKKWSQIRHHVVSSRIHRSQMSHFSYTKQIPIYPSTTKLCPSWSLVIRLPMKIHP